MHGIFMITACLILGKILSTQVKSREYLITSLNTVVIRIALPALILNKIHAQSFSVEAFLPIISPAVILLLTIIFVYLLRLWIPFSKTTTGCLILLAGTSNTAFVGVPLIQALMGNDDYIGVALWVDQANFILLFTVGIFVANFYTGRSTSFKDSLKNLLLYTPIQTLILALLLKPFDYPDFIQTTLVNFGDMVTPLTMLSVGASLRMPTNRKLFSTITIGLTIKLILIPLSIYLLIRYVASSSIPEINQVIVMQSGMAPMVIAAIIATEKNLEPELASLMTAIGIPISFLTVSFWYWLT